MARRTHLQREDKRLLARIRGQQWSADELRWVLTHLDVRAPTLIVQEIHAKLREVSAPNRARTLVTSVGEFRRLAQAHCLTLRMRGRLHASATPLAPDPSMRLLGGRILS